jgi:hypothetical protein
MFAITVKPPSRYSALAALKKWPASSETMMPQPIPVSSRGMKFAVRMKRLWSKNSFQ